MGSGFWYDYQFSFPSISFPTCNKLLIEIDVTVQLTLMKSLYSKKQLELLLTKFEVQFVELLVTLFSW